MGWIMDFCLDGKIKLKSKFNEPSTSLLLRKNIQQLKYQ